MTRVSMQLQKDILIEMRTYKVHPRESDSDCLNKILNHYKELIE